MGNVMKRDLVTGLVWMGIGLLFCAGALSYKLIHLGAYGPGFYPFIVACALVLLSAALILGSYRSREEAAPDTSAEKGLRKIVLALIGLFGFGIFLPYAGFLLTTFILLLFLLRFIEPVRWVAAVFTAAATTGVCYALFVRWLGVQMPRGILYF